MDDKINALAKKMSDETLARLRQQGLTFPGYEKHAETTVIPGRKYTKIDMHNGGRLMIDEAGNIFGIKGYGQVNKAKQYGTLDTTDDYEWGDYYPRPKWREEER